MSVTHPRKLRGRTRKLVLVLHIVSAAAWFGIDVVLAVLVFTAMASGDAAVVATCLQALELFAVWPMLTASVAGLVTGLVLGLGSKYGLFRYWWVAAKFAINVGMSVLIVVALRTGVDAAAVAGERIAAGASDVEVPMDLVFPPIVSPTLLLVAYVLSVFKPWGRIRRTKTTTTRRDDSAARSTIGV